MKAKQLLLYALTFLPMAATIVSLFFLPDIIATKYDFSGNVTATDSKFLLLATPVFPILFGLFSARLWKLDKDMKRVDTSERAKTIVNVSVLVLFNAITYWLLFSTFARV